VECAVAEFAARDERQTLVVSRLPDGELAELHAWLAVRGRTLESVGVPPGRLEQLTMPDDPHSEEDRAWA
jgi:hypothetical protein